MRRVAVVGGGASGCMAAIAAARSGGRVDLFEKNDKLAKKIYATGNGRCNLTNLCLDASCYRSGGDTGAAGRVLKILESFSREDLLAFFSEAGVPVHNRDGYVYPRTDQAETVALALEKQLRLCGVRVRTGCEVVEVVPAAGTKAMQESQGRQGKQEYLVCVSSHGKERKYRYDAVILCTGGLAGPSFGCSGDGYEFASSLSHSVVTPLPSLTKLKCRAPHLKRAAGVRCHASVTLLEEVPGSKGEHPSRDKRIVLACEEGEVQLTEDSLSGIPVFQLSGLAARSLEGHRQLTARVDFLPEYTPQAYEEEVRRRLSETRDQMLGSLLLGLVHRKIIDMVLARAGLQAEMKAKRLSDGELKDLLAQFQSFEFEITGTGSFSQAQVTSGGVPLAEVDDSLESKIRPGLFMTGELLDVDGRCGGYNLQWAMSSGWIAGRAAAGNPVRFSC